MKTCTVCGREVSDDAVQCPHDGGALVASGSVRGAAGRDRLEVDVAPDEDDAPETVVRPRRAEPIAPPNFTSTPLVHPSAPAPAAPAPARPTGPTTVVVPERRMPWAAIAGIVVVLALLASAGAYFALHRSSQSAVIASQIGDARIAIADAKARIESLPTDHPLRKKIITLDKWDRELQGYLASHEQTPEMGDRAREIVTQAQSVADEARAAGATAPVNAVVPPVTAPPNANTVPAETGGAKPGEEPGAEPPSPAPAAPHENGNTPPAENRNAKAQPPAIDQPPVGPGGAPTAPPRNDNALKPPAPKPPEGEAPPPPPPVEGPPPSGAESNPQGAPAGAASPQR